MLIRKYNDSDIETINKFGNAFHTNYVFNLDSFSDCLVILDDNNIVGFVVYSIIYDRAEIIDIFIKKDKRKKGFAKALLEKVINMAYDKKCYNITLEVNVNNYMAISLYKNFGFNEVCRRKNYYNNLDDALVMKKDLR